MTTETTSVFVSGATGFIAQYVVLQLLAKGYKVVGTVRTQEKGEHLKNLLKSNDFSYEVVPDVEPEGAFDEALKKHPEVTVFLHTASPFHFKATDIEKELLLTAVNGTKNALRAIKAHGPQIKRVVVTSSYAAIMNMKKLQDPSHLDTEESWNPMTWDEAKENAINGYMGLKKFAEEAAWDFVKEEKPKYVINYVNPVYVFGPQLFDSEVKPELNTSNEFINSLLSSKPGSDAPDTAGYFIDVRDVAKAHIVAFEKDISNERLLMASERFTSQDLLDIINENFIVLKGTIAEGKPGSGKDVKMNQLDNKKTRKILGFELLDLKQSVVDTVAQILKVKQNN